MLCGRFIERKSNLRRDFVDQIKAFIFLEALLLIEITLITCRSEVNPLNEKKDQGFNQILINVILP